MCRRVNLSCFDGCESLTDINIPEGVTVIDTWAFGGCTSLESVTLPSGLQSIEYAAFASSGLRSIEFPDGLKRIALHAFIRCKSLESVVIPGSLEVDSSSSDLYASFHSCRALKTVEFAEGATVVGPYMFRMDPSLETVILPSTMKEIGYKAFQECGTVAIYFKGDPPSCGESIVDHGVGYYPADNPNWTDEAMAGIHTWGSGSITWIPWFADDEPLNSITHAIVSGYEDEVPYSGSAITFPGLAVKMGGTLLTEGADYTVLYSSNTDIGTARIAITGTGDYINSKAVSFEIVDPSAMLAIKTHTAPFFVSQAGTGGADATIKYDWGWSMLTGGSKGGFSDRLAVASLLLCGATEHSRSRAELLMKDMGFTTRGSARYGDNDVNKPAVSFGYRKIAVDGIRKNVFAIAVRGTQMGPDLLTDLYSVVNAFRTAATNTKGSFESFVTEKAGMTLDQLKSDRANNIFLLTGHSLGGAVVNHMALDLGEYADDGSVFAYTFAAPKTTSDPIDRGNLFNVVSGGDVVPGVPLTVSKRNGHDVEWCPAWDNDAYKNAFKELTGKDWVLQSSYTANTISSLLHGWLFASETAAVFSHTLNNHVVETYMAYLMSRHDAAYTNPSSSPDTIRIVCVKCPVDVSVYYGSSLLGKIANNQVDASLGLAIPMFTDGDTKYAVLPSGIDCDVRLEGTDDGTMSCTFTDTELCSEKVVSEKTFDDVALTDGKAMAAEVDSDASASDTELFVVDGADDPVARVTEDGAESPVTSLSKATVTVASATYTGEVVDPAVSVTVGDAKLSEGEDYSLSYLDANGAKVAASELKAAGAYQAVVKGKDSYCNTARAAFEVKKAASQVTLASKSATFTGRAISIGDAKVAGSSGAVSYAYYKDAKCAKKASAHKKAGTYYVRASVAADANHLAATSGVAKLTIKKAANSMSVKAKAKSVTAAKVKAKTRVVAPLTVKKAKGAASYKVTKWLTKGAKKRIAVNAKTGKVTVKKGTPRGVYKFKVKVAAKGNANYKSGSKTVTVKVTVK